MSVLGLKFHFSRGHGRYYRTDGKDWRYWKVTDGTVVDDRKRIRTELRHFAHAFILASFLHYLKQNRR